MAVIILKWTGGGYGGSINGVPARDLTDEDIERLRLNVDELAAGGLYEYAEVKAVRPIYADKSLSGPASRARRRGSAETKADDEGKG